MKFAPVHPMSGLRASFLGASPQTFISLMELLVPQSLSLRSVLSQMELLASWHLASLDDIAARSFGSLGECGICGGLELELTPTRMVQNPVLWVGVFALERA